MIMSDEQRARLRERHKAVRRCWPCLVGLVAIGVVAAAAFAQHGSLDKPVSAGAAHTPTRTVRTPAPKPPAAAPPRPTGTVRITAVGDLVMGSLPDDLPPDGGASLFGSVAHLLTGDVVLGNLEGTLATGGPSKCEDNDSPHCFAFHAPPSYAHRLKNAGFTVLNTANNHIDDFGARGRRETFAALRSVNLPYTGRLGQITLQRVHGIRIALIGFAPDQGANDLTDIPAARQLTARAATMADIVIVTMHAGAEGPDRTHVEPGTEYFLGENRGDPYRFSHAVIDAGADLVIGSGPHVLRGMEFYKGRLIAYSLGNFTAYKVLALGGALSTSAVLHVTLHSDGTYATGRLSPAQLIEPGTPEPGGDAIDLVSDVSEYDFGPHAVHLTSDGTLTRP
jgi:hypothetical protein